MEKILKRKTVYQGRVVGIEAVDIDFDNGKTATFELINFSVITGITILPIDDQHNCYFVKQFKLGAKGKILTLPSGGLEVGKDPIQVANKELQEEIGFKSENLTLMFRSHHSPGYVGSEAAYYYLAKDLVASKLKGDEIESIQIIKLPFEKALKMVRSGEIIDTGSIAAILYYQQFYFDN